MNATLATLVADSQAYGFSLDNLPCQSQVIWHRWLKNADGSAQQYKVTSVKRWKKDANRFRIGIKRGLRGFAEITSIVELDQFTSCPSDVLPIGIMCANGGTENVMHSNGKQYLWTFTPHDRLAPSERHRYWCFDTREFVKYEDVIPDKM